MQAGAEIRGVAFGAARFCSDEIGVRSGTTLGLILPQVNSDFKLFSTYHLSAILGKNTTRIASEAPVSIVPILSFRVTLPGADRSHIFEFVR